YTEHGGNVCSAEPDQRWIDQAGKQCHPAFLVHSLQYGRKFAARDSNTRIPGGGFASSVRKDSHDGDNFAPERGTAKVQHRVAGHLRGGGACIGGYWDLWVDVVFGGTATAGSGHPHGVGRGSRPGAETDSQTRN